MAGKKGMFARPLASPATLEKIRKNIQSGMIINELQKHIFNKREMTNSQVTAALGLLRKVLPDLATVTQDGTEEYRTIEQLSDQELYALASRARIVDAQVVSDELVELHTLSEPKLPASGTPRTNLQ